MSPLPPGIPESCTPEERAATERDAATVNVARLCIRREFSRADWVMAQRAFKLFVAACIRNGKWRGMTAEEVGVWVDYWYAMLSLRRAVAAQDRERRGDNPEGDDG